MKKFKRLLLILLVLTLALSLFACKKDCKHVDEDGDGKCDKCDEVMQTEASRVLLFENGLPNFRFVLDKNLTPENKKLITDYQKDMDDIGLDIDVVADEEDDSAACEILVGDVTSRGDKYKYDKHSLGSDGYIFKIIEEKIIINAGSDKTLGDAIEIFIEEVLMYDEDTEDMGTLYMETSQEVLEIQDDYKITALKVNDIDMKGYTIATNTSKTVYRTAAQTLQSMLYDRTGYWFDIVALDKATAKSVVLKDISKVYGEDSFKIYAKNDGQLVIECAFENKLENAIASFITSKITNADVSGDVNFKGTIFNQDISFLTYEEFGAKGDGKTDDFVAIDQTHREANKYGQTVKAKDGAHYLLKDSVRTIDGASTVEPIPIMTNVNWGTAQFTIDDREFVSIKNQVTDFSPSKQHIFEVKSDYPVSYITDEATLESVIDAGLTQGATKVPLTFDYPVMIIPYDSTHTVYRREGYGSAQGSVMHECLLLDKEGNIDPSTPVMFDYQTLDRIGVYRLDIEPITIEGGTFTTRACRTNAYINGTWQGSYLARGLDVRRSFTTVKGVKHYVTDEVKVSEQFTNGVVTHASPPYFGFFSANSANEITFQDCILTGRRCYTAPGYGTEGTYDLVGGNVNKLTFKNCHQHNFWITYDPSTGDIAPAESRETVGAETSMLWKNYQGTTIKLHWGIGGVNFCRNLEYIDSTLSRFDAHEGLYNGKIINSTVNYMALTGNGKMIVENVDWYSEGTSDDSAAIFHLRRDYGSTWDGEIEAKNLNAYVYTSAPTYLFLHKYTNWFFGYVAHMPNLSLDNLNIYDIETFEPVEAGYRVNMIQNSIALEPQLHLQYTKNTAGKYCYIDLDEDGKVDGTDVAYEPGLATSYKNGVSLAPTHPNYYKNLNVIAPPEYLKIINNDGVDADGNGTPDGGYIFFVQDTSGAAKAADDTSNLDADVDPMGGFFGTTKFWYSETEYYRGTNHPTSQTFRFVR